MKFISSQRVQRVIIWGHLPAMFGPNAVVYYFAIGEAAKMVVLMTTFIEVVWFTALLARQFRKQPKQQPTPGHTHTSTRGISPLGSLLSGMLGVGIFLIFFFIPSLYEYFFSDLVSVALMCPIGGLFSLHLYASLVYYSRLRTEW